MEMGKSKHWQREVWHHGHLHGRKRDIVGIADLFGRVEQPKWRHCDNAGRII
ncbi:MAG: hypothetical protein ACJASD_002044 [Sphingomonas echinoides]|jgi:hypothetical protein